MSTYWCPRCGYSVGSQGHLVKADTYQKSLNRPVYDVDKSGYGFTCQQSEAGDTAMKIIDDVREENGGGWIDGFIDWEVEKKIAAATGRNPEL